MGEDSKIQWCDHTFNGWIGCTKVDDQCAICYAELDSKRRGWAQWGPGRPRMLTSENNWRQPFIWNHAARNADEKPKVFAYSLADVFDAEQPVWPEGRKLWRPRGFTLSGNISWETVDPVFDTPRSMFLRKVVQKTTNLQWIILTKRYQEAAEYFSKLWEDKPWPNVWVVFSAGTQRRVDEAAESFSGFHAAVKGISAEPLLEHITIQKGIDWVIPGGESGHGARGTSISNITSLIKQGKENGFAVFVKQLGARPMVRNDQVADHWYYADGSDMDTVEGPDDEAYKYQGASVTLRLRDKKGGDMAEWRPDLRVRQWPAFHWSHV